METKWKEIFSTTGWKYYAYNPKKEQLYLTSYMSSTVDIIENITKKDFQTWEIIVGSHKREKIEHWIKSKEMDNGISISENTSLLVKDGAYNLPTEYFHGLELNQMKDALKKTYHKETYKMGYFEKKKFIKSKLKEAISNI